MQNLLIDPFTLIYEPNDSKEIFLEYLDNILDTYDLEECFYIKTFITKNTVNLLMEKNNYPEWDDIDKQLLKYNLNREYQAKDIINALEGILNRQTIEEQTEIEDILFEIMSSSDSRFTNRIKDEYIEELKKLIVYYVITRLLIN